MMLNSSLSSQSGKGLSIQTCFPEIKSVTNSFGKSFGEDDVNEGVCSDDQKIIWGHEPSFSLASDFQNSPLQPPQAIRKSKSFLRRNQLTREAVDSVTFPQAAVPQSGVVSGKGERNCFTTYVPLHLAALKGDWDYAKTFFIWNPEAVRARITRNQETALHIAAGARHTTFVQELVNIMTPEDLELQNKVGNTALCFAAVSGIKMIAEVMVNKNKKLPSIRGSEGATPLCMAALLGHKEMVWYLYSVTKQKDLNEEDHIEFLVAVINADLYDVALDLIQNHPELAVARDRNEQTALHVLARKPSAFVSGRQLQGAWKRCIYSLPGFRSIFDTKLRHLQALELVKRLWEQVLLLDDSKIGKLLRNPSRLLFTAAEFGNVEFIKVLIRMYPDLIWKVDDHSRSIFHMAVLHRQENIFNLIHEIGAHKDLIAAYKDENDNNMLHLAAKLAPPDRLKMDSGAALQLRRELHWFKEVEKVVQPSYREAKNSAGKTPRILFSEEHRRLVREGEKWMKDTASSCMFVATLIATVIFAAAFTVPGANNNPNGRPTCHHWLFMVFAISDALALFCSTTAILMFLSILTSRYAEEDFLHSLPYRLIIGLAALFISIATMMSAFGVTLYIVLHSDLAWVAISIFAVACIPVTSFALLQFPLFSDMFSHFYQSTLYSRPSHHLLY